MPRSRALATLLTLTGAVVAMVACGGTDEGLESADAQLVAESLDATGGDLLTADVELPEGWTLAEGTGYEVGLPPGWFDARRALKDEEFMADVTRGLGELTDDDQVRDMLEEGATDGLDLLAFRTADLGAQFATNFNVIVEARGPMDEPEVLREMAPDLLASIGGDVTGTDEYEMRGMPSIEVTYDLELPVGVVVGIQNYLFTDDSIFVATYTAVEPDLAMWQSVLETFTPRAP